MTTSVNPYPRNNNSIVVRAPSAAETHELGGNPNRKEYSAKDHGSKCSRVCHRVWLVFWDTAFTKAKPLSR